MESISLPLRAILDPVGAIPKAVESQRWFFALSLASIVTAASGAVLALRLDAARVVIPKMAMAGELAKASEREISEAIQQAQRIALVGGIAKGLLLMPLIVLLLGVVLKVAAWLIGRKALFISCFTAAALTMLPVAIFHLVEIVIAFSQAVLTPAALSALVPASPGFETSAKLATVLKTVDFFNLWAALVMGLGFAAASQWRPWKGALFGLLLYVLYAGVFLIGVPAIMSGAGPGGH
jgi:hypothetical protein